MKRGDRTQTVAPALNGGVTTRPDSRGEDPPTVRRDTPVIGTIGNEGNESGGARQYDAARLHDAEGVTERRFEIAQMLRGIGQQKTVVPIRRDDVAADYLCLYASRS